MKTHRHTPPLPPLLAALEHQASVRGAACALVDDRESVTWTEFAGRVRRCAAALNALPLRPGERIGIHSLNSIELAVAILACWRAGLVTVLLSPASKGPELAQEMSASGAIAYLADPDLYPVGEEILGRCPEMRLSLLLRRGAVTPETVARFPAGIRAPWPAVPPPGLAAILFSSGTTGIPKGVMHTHATLGAMGEAGPHGLGIAGQHIVFFVAPLGYITGLFPLAQCLAGGHTVVLERRFDPEVLLDTVARRRCTIVYALSPAGCQAVLRAQQARPRDTDSCVYWPAGGDAVPARLLQDWPQLFRAELSQGYSLTENFPALGNLDGGNRRGSMGVAVGQTEIRLVRQDGRVCGAGETGEIQLRGPYLFAGYWNDSETTARLMRDGWFRTGDLAERDEDGYYWFRGRTKEIITCDGEKISPQHVESALLEHPDVLAAGVVGRPDAAHGQAPVAFVQLRPGAQIGTAGLRDFVRARVEDCGVPADIVFADDLPHGRTGKVDRRRLTDRIPVPQSNPGRGFA